jgi:hypothetical protein
MTAAGSRVVLALVDVGGTGAASVNWLEDALGVPVLLIPHDNARSAGVATPSSSLGTRTRLAYGQLAGALVRAAERTTPDRHEVSA